MNLEPYRNALGREAVIIEASFTHRKTGVIHKMTTAMPRLIPNWRGMKSDDAIQRVRNRLPENRPLLELFGGTGKLTLDWPHPTRWWNDKDRSLFQLAHAIKHDWQPLKEAIRELPKMGDPQKAFDKAWQAIRDKPRSEWSPAELVWAARVTFAARLGGRAHAVAGDFRILDLWLERLPILSDSMKSVKITNLDWEDALAQVPSDWLIYADPPYESSITDSYAHQISPTALLETLEAMPNPMCIAGYSYSAMTPRLWQRFTNPIPHGRTSAATRFNAAFKTEHHWARNMELRGVHDLFEEMAAASVPA